ncbi:VC0807 family protein [Nocardioides okcheonensis]|uniref:VC0807 family protein n=1 Tax=Nocardioides okcheonensis TaxID=2894081 RepID=UPI001E294FB9|nr:VC0807 family protein [Nocardioides okcheonensis]UFN45163.1 hypothetical protein LN652_02815 [Nocardioides okcheonensis]
MAHQGDVGFGSRHDEIGRAPNSTHSPWSLLISIAAPLVIYYGPRVLGYGPTTALILGAGLATCRLIFTALLQRRVEKLSAVAVLLIVVGTAVGLVDADPRLVMARGSWVTAFGGLWLLGSLLASRPAVLTATLPFMAPAQVEEWERLWEEDPPFRELIKRMTVAFGAAFLLDAVARVIFAFTLPLDVVPLLSSLMLVAMLAGVVLTGRRIARPTRTPEAAAPPRGSL